MDSVLRSFIFIQTLLACFLFHSNLGYLYDTFYLVVILSLILFLKSASRSILIAIFILGFFWSNFFPISLNQLPEDSQLRDTFESFFNQATQNPWTWEKSHFKEHREFVRSQLTQLDFGERDVVQGICSHLRPFQSFSFEFVIWQTFGDITFYFNSFNSPPPIFILISPPFFHLLIIIPFKC